MKTLVWIALALCVFTAAVQAKRKKVNEFSDFAITGEAALYKDLMRRYDYLNPDRAIRPVANVSTTMDVRFGMAIIYFLDYDSDKNMATFSSWDRFMWDDRLLTWEPEEYGNINHLRIPISKIWKPDMILYNGFDPKQTDIDDEVLAVASSDGTVHYIPRVNRKVICDTNSSGIISCSFKFGSWTYDSFKVDVNFYNGMDELDLTDFKENKDYDLVGNSAVKHTKYYPCCMEPYPDLTFTLEFKRKKYMQESPDYCEQNLAIGSLGTRGRQCNRTSYGLDGCTLMCCGRGYHIIVLDVQEDCNCKFFWCCETKCDKCHKRIEQYFCN